ncbi:MAG TPA: glycosyltransferase [Polyangia bacterium]|nr:glycosyltransferase [Polyangia bacterium]
MPYAHALEAHGHEVKIAGPVDIAETLSAAGLAHAPFGHPGDATLAPIWARLRGAPPDESLALAIRELFAGLNAKAALPQLMETIDTWRPDLVVRDSVEFASAVAAERAGVPHARVAVHMVSFEEIIPALAADPLDELRRAAGLTASGTLFLSGEPVFSAFPASLDDSSVAIGQPPLRVRMIEDAPGAAPATWAPPGDERPLVYITFGTIVGTSPALRGVYRTALDAIASLPVSALLTTGRGMEEGTLGAIPANVHVEEWVPQRDVMARAAAVVCHGGSGTVRGSLAAGVPMVVVPQGADQPHNARRIAAVGAGLALPGADAGILGAAVARVLAVADFGRAARRIADEIAALPSVETAVAAMVAMASQPRK